MLSGSGRFLGKSAVLSEPAGPPTVYWPGTPLEAPSVNNTITRRLDWFPAGTDRSSSYPRHKPSSMFVLPPGSEPGTAALIVVLSNPRLEGIWYRTEAPL